MAHTRRLDEVEIRVLGSLMEKEQTTPEYYPLTVNSLRAACNQKTGRDPVTDLSETEVLDALERLRRDTLVWRSTGARAERWEHRLTSRWYLGAEAKAVMTLLLLRGPQTPGELRTRSQRLYAFPSPAALEETLQSLATGDDALVAELPRLPGQREGRWRHLMGENAEAEAESMPSGTTMAPATTATAKKSPVAGAVEARLSALEQAVDGLRSEVRRLKERYDRSAVHAGVEEIDGEPEEGPEDHREDAPRQE